MLKTATFAAMTLLATLTAVQATIKNAVSNLPSPETQWRCAGPLRAKMPPRRSFGARDAAFGIKQKQLD